jgi:hypothetical protein
LNRRRWVALTVALLPVAGMACSSDDDPEGAATSSSTMSVPEGIELGDRASTTVVATTTPPPVAPEEVRLSGTGVADRPIGSTPEVDVLTMLTPLLGEPEVTAAECPGGSDRAARFDVGLTVYFAGGQLSGWAFAAGDEVAGSPVLTDRDLRPGDTVTDLLAAYPDDFQWIEDSTLGTEFFIGTGFPYVGGTATGTEPNDTVEVLWAGDACLAR